MRLALYQPDQPGNTGTLIRTAACLAVGIDVIEPCGFPFSVHALRRAGLDYVPKALIRHHADFGIFQAQADGRLVLLTTKASTVYTDFSFAPDDILIVGRESAGVPDAVHEVMDGRIRIPMAVGMRSVNVAIAAAMVLGEALRQVSGFPPEGNG